MLRGIGALSAGELAGERMAVAYETKDQEDEHSCFSDNTNADVRRRRDRHPAWCTWPTSPASTAPSISDLVQQVDPELDTKLTAQLDTVAGSSSRRFPAPFEELIVGADTATRRRVAFAGRARPRSRTRAS